MSMSEIRRIYKVPATRRRAVMVDGRLGVIIGSKGHYIRVRFLGETHAVNCHPTWEVDYSPMLPPPAPEKGE